MMLQCATCSRVDSGMYDAHGAVLRSDCEAGRPRNTKPRNNFTQQCSSHCQEQHQSIYVTDIYIGVYTLKCRVKSGYCCRVLTAEDYHQLSLSYPTDSTGHDISSSVTSFCERLFSVCGLLTVGRRNRMDK